jgi:hypothetical protein
MEKLASPRNYRPITQTEIVIGVGILVLLVINPWLVILICMGYTIYHNGDWLLARIREAIMFAKGVKEQPKNIEVHDKKDEDTLDSGGEKQD